MQLNSAAMRAIRERSGMSLATLSRETGIAPETLTRLQQGKRRGTDAQIVAIAEALRVPVTAIVAEAAA